MEGAYVPNYKLVQKKSSSVKFIQPIQQKYDIQSDLEKLFYGKRSSIPSQNIKIGTRSRNRKIFDLDHLSIQSLGAPKFSSEQPIERSRNNICKSAFSLPTILNVSLPKIKTIEEPEHLKPIPMSKRCSIGNLFSQKKYSTESENPMQVYQLEPRSIPKKSKRKECATSSDEGYSLIDNINGSQI